MKRLLLAYPVAVLLAGCSGEPAKVENVDRAASMTATAQRLEQDVDASPEARKIASGVLQQTRQQQEVDKFESGN